MSVPFSRLLVATWFALASSACANGRSGQVMGPPDTTTTPPPPPPPPAPPVTFDLRFKGVGILSSNVDVTHTDIYATNASFTAYTVDSMTGSPLELGTGLCSATTCAWFFDVFTQPAGVARVGAAYKANILANLPFVLDTATSDTVITSFDLEPAESLFAIAQLATSQRGGYHLVPGVVPLSGLQAAALQEGAQHRVITALSFDSGAVHYLSYAWQHDSTAGYDAEVVTASFSTVGTAAMGLAANGYTITALGGDSTDGFVLVGTRVTGASTPRSLLVNPAQGTDLTGYAPVGYVIESPPGTLTLLLEK